MAAIHKEIEINKSAEFVWDAISDVGAIHKRLVPGFVADCKLEDGARIVTFANGMVARELIVSIDDAYAGTRGRREQKISFITMLRSRCSRWEWKNVEWFGSQTCCPMNLPQQSVS